MPKVSHRIPCPGVATGMSRWLTGSLLVLVTLASATSQTKPQPKTDRATSSGKSATSKKLLIIDALITATTRAAPSIEVNGNEALPDTIRLLHKDSGTNSGMKRVERATFNKKVDEFGDAWKTLDWEHHWSLLVMTVLVSATTLVLVSVVIAVTCSPQQTTMSRAALDKLRLENAVRGRFLYARQLWRARKKEEQAKTEESQSLLERAESIGSAKGAEYHHGSLTSQKLDKSSRKGDVDVYSESNEQLHLQKKMSSRRHKPKTSSYGKKSHRMLRHEMAGVYK